MIDVGSTATATPAGARALAAIAAALWQVVAALPGRPCADRELRQLAGSIFFEAPAFCFLTRWALERHPELYPDLRHHAPAIGEHQACADEWHDIEILAGRLHSFARHNRLREQAHAVQRAKAVFARVAVTGAEPALLPDGDHEGRRLRLYSAYLVLRRHLRKTGRQHRPPAATAAQAAPNKAARAGRGRFGDEREPLRALFQSLLRGTGERD